MQTPSGSLPESDCRAGALFEGARARARRGAKSAAQALSVLASTSWGSAKQQRALAAPLREEQQRADCQARGSARIFIAMLDGSQLPAPSSRPGKL